MLTLFLIIHFIGLCIGVGASLCNALLNLYLTQQNKGDIPQETRSIITSYLFHLGIIGLALLVISGIVLMVFYHPFVTLSFLFWLKLFVVSILIALIYQAKQLFKEPNPSHRTVTQLTRIRLFNPALSLSIVILAVLAFQ